MQSDISSKLIRLLPTTRLLTRTDDRIVNICKSSRTIKWGHSGGTARLFLGSCHSLSVTRTGTTEIRANSISLGSRKYEDHGLDLQSQSCPFPQRIQRTLPVVAASTRKDCHQAANGLAQRHSRKTMDPKEGYGITRHQETNQTFHNKQKAKNVTNLSREHSAQRDGNGLCLMAQNAKQTEWVKGFCSHVVHVFSMVFP